MKANLYVIVTRAIEEGIHAGLNLAGDHGETGAALAQRLYDEIMLNLSEVIEWDDGADL
jgi:hypothetical protein